MSDKIFQKIVKDIEKYIINLAEQNGWTWFYKAHQKEMVACAKELLGVYKADKKMAVIACWLHDITLYQVKNGSKEFSECHKTHHVDSCEFSKTYLEKYKLKTEEIESISQCILRHRNSAPFKVRNIEEKIVAAADTMSHFTGIFYLMHFKFHPDDSVEEMNKKQSQKLERDWRDLQLLPKARKLVEKEYKVLRKLVGNYNN